MTEPEPKFNIEDKVVAGRELGRVTGMELHNDVWWYTVEIYDEEGEVHEVRHGLTDEDLQQAP